MARVGMRGLVVAIALLAAACASDASVDLASEASVAPTAAPEAVVENPATEVTTAAPSPTSSAAPSPTSSDAPSTTEAPVGELVNLVGGGQLDLNSIEGTDTVLWFWAPW